MPKHEFTIGHLFAGIGGGALGAQEARVRLGDHEASFRTVGGVDVDEGSCLDFEYLTGADATQADLHTMQPADLRAAWGESAPDMVLLSPPCKGFSGLLSKAASITHKYKTLNRLLLDGLFLACATWDEPPSLIFVENVPRITARGAALLDQARQLLRGFGYRVTADDYHDCGEIGGLAQHRKRFFLVARCERRVPHYVYQPGRHKLQTCGDVLGPLPTPGDEVAGGPLHRLPRMSWTNWARLACIPAGGDWRDLPGVVPEGAKRRTVHRRHMVVRWDMPTPTVAGSGSNAVQNVSDPRIPLTCSPRSGAYGVAAWDGPSACVTGSMRVDNSRAAVADPRLADGARYRRVTLDEVPEGKGRPDFIPVIVSDDGAWHRPMTTLELAALQGFPVMHEGAPLQLSGARTTDWRERIGNAIPPPAARAIASEMLLALLASHVDHSQLRLDDVWVDGLDGDPVYAAAFLDAIGAA